LKALITGGAGFIGSHICERLVNEGHDVVVYDNFTTGKRENLRFPGSDRVAIVEADVRDLPQLDFHVAGCDVVFHEAAIVSVPYSVDHPQETHDVNLQGTLNLLEAAKRRRVRRVVFACSAAVYGDEPGLPKHEDMRASPISPYGIEKLASELYLQAWARLYGIETVSLRYFNVFGPRQDPGSAYSGVISIFVDRALRGEAPTFFGDGQQCRDFVYIANVVDANLRAATTPGVSGRCYNVGCGQRTTLRELLAAIARIVGKPIEPKLAPARPGDIADSLADITRARAELGYEPKVGVEEGLRHLIDHLKKTP
jgi:UDP-glucose 4-epimerase